MGSEFSSLITAPLLISTAIVLMVIALIYQKKTAVCGAKTDNYGSEVFKLNLGVASVVVIISTVVSFIMAFMV
jgi:hypothetical protein